MTDKRTPEKLDPAWLRKKRKDINLLRRTFREHFLKRARSFPWRIDLDPFQTLITECLLQRTRADIVAKIWPDFMARFSTVENLADSSEESIRKVIRPLGLAWRAGFLKKLADEIRDRFQGTVPSKLEALISLPGVGPYAGTATRSFGHGIREGITDSNMVRVFSRYFDIKIEGDKAPLRYWQPLSKKIANSPYHKAINYGMLDFASDVCTPRNPVCQACKLKRYCFHGRSK